MKIKLSIPQFELVSRIDSSKIVDAAGQPITGFSSEGLMSRIALSGDVDKAEVKQIQSIAVEGEIPDGELRDFILKAVADDLRANGDVRKAVLSLPSTTQ